MKKYSNRDISILIAGAAGQGIQTIGTLLTKVCHNAGLFIFSIDDFESRIRGGHNYHLLRISDKPVMASGNQPDILVVIDDKTYKFHKDKLSSRGITLLNSSDSNKEKANIYTIPLERMAKEAGGKIAANTVAAGAILAILGAALNNFENVLEKQFNDKKKEVLDLNLQAAKIGYARGKKIKFSIKFDFKPAKHQNRIMKGAKAAALGALAADCRFAPFYPMSPGTSIVSNLIQYSDKLPIVIEQAEDEIAAVNMAVGASFAGVRSMTSTSGGGFCLMTEGLGLSAMTETPIVIINAQRPGPATGLATRTTQADLLFTINASQDEFPRFVFAPGGVLETFNTVKKAFSLSEKYQVPAIVLMDQYLADLAKTESDVFEIGDEHKSFLETETTLHQETNYLRYKITKRGVSPRKIPCDSTSLVRASGNEHSQMGLTSEDSENRKQMVKKRFKKIEFMKEEMTIPSIFHEKSLFILTAWGSTKGCVVEAGTRLREEGFDTGWLIFEDIWPLNFDIIKKRVENKKLIIVEGNATSQLGSLIRQQTGVGCFETILKYDGRPFYPEYIIEKVKQIVKIGETTEG